MAVLLLLVLLKVSVLSPTSTSFQNPFEQNAFATNPDLGRSVSLTSCRGLASGPSLSGEAWPPPSAGLPASASIEPAANRVNATASIVWIVDSWVCFPSRSAESSPKLRPHLVWYKTQEMMTQRTTGVQPSIVDETLLWPWSSSAGTVETAAQARSCRQIIDININNDGKIDDDDNNHNHDHNHNQPQP